MRFVFASMLLCCTLVTGQRFANFAKPDGPSANQNGLECFCLPPNQRCDPQGAIPRSAVKIEGVVNTRIINRNPESVCSENRLPCCFGVPPGTGGNGGIPHVKPPPLTGSQLSCGRQSTLEPRKLAGQADFGEYPWMALITGKQSDFVGSGALLSPFYVITAAHRLPHRNEWKSLVVRLGDYDIANEFDRSEYRVQNIAVADVIVHPGFNRTTLANDIALIQLTIPVQFGHHTLPVCLPERGQQFVGQRCYVTGWGQDVKGSFQTILKEVDLPIVDSYECETKLQTTELSRFFKLDKKSFMCAGGELGKDACEGDGGAPLVCKEPGSNRFVVVGLVAWGRLCGTDIPGVYVNVENYADFINSYINQAF